MRAASHSVACVSGRECSASSSLLPNPCISARNLIHYAVGTHVCSSSNQVGLLASRRWPHQQTRWKQPCIGPILSAASRKVRYRTHSSSGNLDSTSANDSVYPLEKTKTLVETAMLAAVSGLAYLLSTILKLEASLGYFLPLPVVLAAMRGGPAAGWKTMMATGFLLVVLLGPLRAISYLLIHGLLAASLASLWRAKASFWLCVAVGATVRMAGQLMYLVLSSVTMNENLFSIMMSNLYAMLDQVSANIGFYGSPSPITICCVLFALLSVNASCYVFLLQVVYRVLLQSMGYSMGPLPGIIKKYLYAGMPDPEDTRRK